MDAKHNQVQIQTARQQESGTCQGHPWLRQAERTSQGRPYNDPDDEATFSASGASHG